jgi:hypothetical protein
MIFQATSVWLANSSRTAPSGLGDEDGSAWPASQSNAAFAGDENGLASTSSQAQIRSDAIKLNLQIQRLRIDGLQPHHELRFAAALRSELERLASGPEGTLLRSRLRTGPVDPLRLRRLLPNSNRAFANDPALLGKATANAIFQELMP